MASTLSNEHRAQDEPAEEITREHLFQTNDKVGKDIVHDARAAAHVEHQMTVWEGLKTYPKAIAWSVAVSTCIIMIGYDTLLLGSFFAMPVFNKEYGQPDGKGGYTLSTAWQIGLNDGNTCGSICGIIAGGWLADKYGYKRVLGSALIMISAFIFITFFAPDIIVLEIGIILCGIPWGIFQSISVTYAAEVCPTKLRCYLTNYINLCWIIGQIIGSGVLRGVSSIDSKWSFKIPFAVQWAWPVPIFIAICLAPESPWWLIRHGRIEEAKRSLRALASSGEWFNVDETIALMIHTNELEKQTAEGTSYLDCFKGVNLRRTEVVFGTWLCQCLCGEQLMGYSIYFMEQSGLPPADSFTLGIAQYLIGGLGALLSWVLMTHFGRRTIFLHALFGLFIMLLVIGGLGIPTATDSTSWAVGSLMLIWTFIYDSSIGSVVYSIISEIPSSRLRQKTIGLGIILTYLVATAYTSVISLYMLNTNGWNWGAKAGFFWAAHCAVCFTWAFFRLPEPKDRTYAELEVLFEQRVPTRKFKTAIVDPYKVREKTIEQEAVTEKNALSAVQLYD